MKNIKWEEFNASITYILSWNDGLFSGIIESRGCRHYFNFSNWHYTEEGEPLAVFTIYNLPQKIWKTIELEEEVLRGSYPAYLGPTKRFKGPPYYKIKSIEYNLLDNKWIVARSIEPEY